jgi:RimJ/RimL family protein N-acetyltransferase
MPEIPRMNIAPSTPADIEEILQLCDLGIQFQKTVFHRHWFGFDRDLLVREIDEGRHWKVMEGDTIVCVYSVLYDDPVVWSEDPLPSIYLHRIVTHPAHKGNGYVRNIVDWAKIHGQEQGLQYIRLDTFPDNEKLKAYYVRCGFRFYGFRYFDAEEVIPEHYRDGLSLFEMDV